MGKSSLPDQYKHLEIPDRVTFQEGSAELTKVGITTPTSDAEVYLHGAHLTHFQLRGQPPLLFLSKFSRFAPQQAIRGGIPFIFPWFGGREGEPMHGFARLVEWELHESLITPDNAVRLTFKMPDCSERALTPPFDLSYSITITDTLSLEASVQNVSPDTEFPFEICLHTYLSVSDIKSVKISGLKGTHYLDKVDNFAQKTESSQSFGIQSEVDRVYLDTDTRIEVEDPGNKRRIIVDKTGSNSTVVWNPWIQKTQQISDLGNDEYLNMLCVESGNIGKNKINLQPGQTASLGVTLSQSAL